ncbi:telomere-protecting terminal protein Tpg, partial [Streptomyces sp. NPDC057543]|uniref:telomere-protecting terminal protein Tpg n=1 Tax=Streptomyces sp. NPDC057543 TaxID=3346163 RepID=UPI00368065A6
PEYEIDGFVTDTDGNEVTLPAATTYTVLPAVTGITVETRARFGYTAPVGTTDDGRFRRLTVRLPATYAQRLFDARDAGASDQEMRGIIAEGFKDVYFQDGGGRAMGLSDVAINDIDYLDLDY